MEAEGGYASKGSDTEGKTYGTLQAMWEDELEAKDSEGQLEWYTKAVKYWQEQPATVDGVLGGFGHLSDMDLKESAAFILPFMTSGDPPMKRGRALDLGAGVGRVTQGLMMRLGFEKTDLLEPCKHMLDQASINIPAERRGDLMQKSIQEIDDLGEGRYDLIVLQWVAIYLHDDDFIRFLKIAKRSLTPGGILFFKENSSPEDFLVDKEDSSVTRSDKHYRYLISEAGLSVVKFAEQKEFPAEMFKVLMYGLR